MQAKLCLILLFSMMFGSFGATIAAAESKEVLVLTKQVAALIDEVERLKITVESLQAIRPTIATLMPDFAERFHVMHYAGEAEDWAVASHELLELRRLVEVMKRVNPEKGSMVDGFLLGNFNKFDAAIEHENLKSFNKALVETVVSCNSCHVAAGSPSTKIALDARDSLSMRHPHVLSKSSKPSQHTHMH